MKESHGLTVITEKSAEELLKQLYPKADPYRGASLQFFNHPKTRLRISEFRIIRFGERRFSHYFENLPALSVEFNESDTVEPSETHEHIFTKVAHLINEYKYTCMLQFDFWDYTVLINTPEGLVLNSETPFLTEKRKALFNLPYSVEPLSNEIF